MQVGFVCSDRQRFASMCLVIYLFECSAIGYVPTSSVIHLVCCCLQEVVNTERLENHLSFTAPWEHSDLKKAWARGSQPQFSCPQYFLLFLRKTLMWELVRKGICCYMASQCQIMDCDFSQG